MTNDEATTRRRLGDTFRGGDDQATEDEIRAEVRAERQEEMERSLARLPATRGDLQAMEARIMARLDDLG